MTIIIRDRKEVLEIKFQDIKKYHGNVALMAVAVGFRSLQAAFQELYSERIPEQRELSIVSGHGGPGFRDAFEYVTRSLTRGTYQVDVNYPVAQYDPHRPQSYAFVISNTEGQAVEVCLREDFLPHEFYEYLKKGRENTMTEQEEEDFGRLKETLSERALQLPQDQLLSLRRMS